MADHLAGTGRMILLEAAPTSAANGCDTTVFRARRRREYLQLFCECGLRVHTITGVDPAPFKTWLMPQSAQSAASGLCRRNSACAPRCPVRSTHCSAGWPSSIRGTRSSFSSGPEGSSCASAIERCWARCALAAWRVFVFLARSSNTLAGARRRIGRNVSVAVTNAADRGLEACVRRYSLAAGARGSATILIRVDHIAVETALPPLVNAHGVTLNAQAPGRRSSTRARWRSGL